MGAVLSTWQAYTTSIRQRLLGMTTIIPCEHGMEGALVS